MSSSSKKKGSANKSTAAESEKAKTGTPPAAKVSHVDSPSKYYIALTAVVAMAIYTRFINIGTPSKVVFDEVHFGKFASYYLERTYFFDLHPPFAKLLIALIGYLVGYNGEFKFDKIGDDYVGTNAPYVAYRMFSAVQGTLTIPLMFCTLKNWGFSALACSLASIIVCFDCAHVIDSRLILLDATLNLSVAATIFCYSKYSMLRKQPYTRSWWIWLHLTGVSLSCVISTKYVGVLTYVMVGIGIITELWVLLDYKRGLSLIEVGQHFFARFWALIAFPFTIYLFWFYIHFSILCKSGPGDSFMSAEFQETLDESPIAKDSKLVRFFDVVTFLHKDTDAFLHGSMDKYPLRYEDGRISSNSEIVSAVTTPGGLEHLDKKNHWQILPARDSQASNSTDLYTGDIVRLKNIGTGGYLLSHDVASPLKATHEEFTLAFDVDANGEKYQQTLFKIGHQDVNAKKRKLVKSIATAFKVLHVDTMVAMWTHDDELLPEWGKNQQEVCGNKKLQDKDNLWIVDGIVGMKEDDPRKIYVPKVKRHISFIKKWMELQSLMFYHNSILTSEHPFASQPGSWPLAVSGVSFWNDNASRRQIFFLGNIIGYWIEVSFLSIYVGMIIADQLATRRNVHYLTKKAKSRLYNTLGFLFIGWVAHYFPFFLMGRQKFLHHYMPAHLIAALFTGGLVEFVCSNNTSDSSKRPLGITKRKLQFLFTVCSAGIIWFFFFYWPVMYGDAMTPEQVRKRNWLDIELHYAK